jgi:enoyl-CoA hydratase
MGDATDVLRDDPAEGVARITLNRPDALNSLTFGMYERLIEAFEAVWFDASVRVVVLTGAGRAFCAGHDVRDGGTADWVDARLGKAQRSRAIMEKICRLPVIMRSLPQPVIAAVNGTAAGAGYSLALAADMCVAARTAKFVNAYHNAGSGHEFGLSYLLPRAVGAQRAAELLLTGRVLPAEEAAAIGMVLRVVDAEALAACVLELADAVAVNSPIGIALTKSSLWMNAHAGSLEQAIELENRGVFMSQTTADTAEKRLSFVEKRRPRFTGQ